MARRALVVPDKFRGTASAVQVIEAVSRAAIECGWEVDGQPMADGGDGTLDIVADRYFSSNVFGPLGDVVEARWGAREDVAIIEMAQASGLGVIGGAENNDATRASTFGTGQLIEQAIKAGFSKIVVGVGGSATTDGGAGALEALEELLPLVDVELTVITDVNAKFLDCVPIYGPQKGLRVEQFPSQIAKLTSIASNYSRRFGIDVLDVPGTGAAGGLAGGLYAIGARIEPGVSFVSALLGLENRANQCDLIITGEGKFDRQSLQGKVVAGMMDLGGRLNLPVLVIAGMIDKEGIEFSRFANNVTFQSLVERFGQSESIENTDKAIEYVAKEFFNAIEDTKS